MALGYVLGFFAGPPCETFSIARGNELEGVSVRTIRDGTRLWQFDPSRTPPNHHRQHSAIIYPAGNSDTGSSVKLIICMC